MPEGTDVIQDGSEMQKIIEGDAHFHRLGWKCVTVILIINAIALDSLSLPAAFASLGMVAGVLVCIGIGFIAIYTSLIIGQVKLEFPAVAHYVDIGRLMMGGFGAILVMFVSGAILVIFYLPPVMWFVLLKEGAWYDRENIKSSVCNGIVFVIGITIIGCSTYASIVGMIQKFDSGSVGDHFHVPAKRDISAVKVVVRTSIESENFTKIRNDNEVWYCYVE